MSQLKHFSFHLLMTRDIYIFEDKPVEIKVCRLFGVKPIPNQSWIIGDWTRGQNFSEI